MPFPRRLLHDGEEVVLDLRPHWIRLVRPVVLTVVVLACCGFAYVEVTSHPRWLEAALGAVAFLALVVCGVRVLVWRSTLFALTTNRVVYRRGIVRRIGREIPIDRVQDVTYVQRIVERIVGAGSLVVESAGERGSEPFPDIRHPDRVQSTINRVIVDARRSVGIAPPTPTADLGFALDELEKLHRRGVLTDTEFAEKKQELLDRM